VMACCVVVFQPRLANEDSFAATNVCLLPMTSVATCCVAVPTNAEPTFHDSKFLSRILGQVQTRKAGRRRWSREGLVVAWALRGRENVAWKGKRCAEGKALRGRENVVLPGRCGAKPLRAPGATARELQV